LIVAVSSYQQYDSHCDNNGANNEHSDAEVATHPVNPLW
jgi:hypothetical protein